MENPFCNIIFHGKMHICAKYGNFMMKYAKKMAMIKGICIENLECSYMVSLFVKVFFFKICQNSSLSFFLTNSTYKKTPCKRFAFFDIFFIFFDFFRKGKKTYCRRLSSGTAGTRKATTGGLRQEPPVVVGYYRRLSSRTAGSSQVPINSKPSPPNNLSPGGFVFGAVMLAKF